MSAERAEASDRKVGFARANETVYWSRTTSFARRTRSLTPAQRRAFSELAPKYLLDLQRGPGETTLAAGQRLDPDQVYGRQAPLVVEIGSGSGEQVVWAASQRPDCNYLAFEVWRPGVAKMMNAAAQANLDNLHIVNADAVQSLPIILGEATVSEVWTFFPDPWRKARHHKRRLIQPSFAGEVARLLVDGGRWLMATDWEDYAEQIVEVIAASPDFENPHGGYAPRFAGRMLTRFEQRGLAEGRTVHDVESIRRPRQAVPNPKTDIPTTETNSPDLDSQTPVSS